MFAKERQFHGEAHVLFLRSVGLFSGIPEVALFKASSAHLIKAFLNSIIKSLPSLGLPLSNAMVSAGNVAVCDRC